MDLHRALRFDNRANLETLAILKSGNAPAHAIDILAYTVAVSQLWLSRATGTAPPSSMRPRWAPPTIEAQLDSFSAGWKSCLIGHPGRSFDDVNTRSEAVVTRRKKSSQKSSVILRTTEGRWLSCYGKMVLHLLSQPISFPHCEPASFDLALRVAPE